MMRKKAKFIYTPGSLHYKAEVNERNLMLSFIRTRKAWMLLEPQLTTATQYSIEGDIRVIPKTALALVEITEDESFDQREDGLTDGQQYATVLLKKNASLIGLISGTVDLTDGDTIDITIDGVAQTITFNTGDFSNIAAATIAEIATAIDAQLTTGSASAVICGLKITGASEEEGTANISITESEVAYLLGFEPETNLNTNAETGRMARSYVTYYKADDSVLETVISDISYTQYEPVIPSDIRVKMGFGMDFARGDGTAQTDDDIWLGCKAGRAKCETAVHIFLVEKRCICKPGERDITDYDLDIDPYTFSPKTNLTTWGFVQLRHHYINEILGFQYRFPIGGEMVTYPSDWIRVRRKSGQLNVIPQVGSSSIMALGQGGHMLSIHSVQARDVPSVVYVDYLAGMRKGEIFNLENADLRDAAMREAAIWTFHIAGDAKMFGIASQSISDGVVNESISTTAGVENALLGARIVQYKKELYGDQNMAGFYKDWRKKNIGVRMVVI